MKYLYFNKQYDRLFTRIYRWNEEPPNEAGVLTVEALSDFKGYGVDNFFDKGDNVRLRKEHFTDVTKLYNKLIFMDKLCEGSTDQKITSNILRRFLEGRYPLKHELEYLNSLYNSYENNTRGGIC